MALLIRSMAAAPRSSVFRMAPLHTIMRAMAHDHEHHHHHDHEEHGSELSEMQLRVRALETVLGEKGYFDPAAIDALIQAYETKVGPHIGARVVAKAWSDPVFKQALIADATKAVLNMGALNRV